jgi:transcriptional regulator with PAS, ATPase and Fis domain
LQERQIRRVGDLAYRNVDIRVVAATNCDVPSMIRRSEFREDLYYRLNVFSIHIPPLRSRLEDIDVLARHILNGRQSLSRDALHKLELYDFPGNVRELENIVESALYSAEGEGADVIQPEHILLPSDGHQLDSVDVLIVDNFWESVARPYSDRLITRTHVEQIIRRGLSETNGSYRRLVQHFKMPQTDYKRFMDFLRRHHCNVDFRQYRKRLEE